MDQNEVAGFARRLMREHGVGHLSLEFVVSKRNRGECVFDANGPVKIVLSKFWTKRLPERLVADTILHEIAHAIVGYEAGHGPDWKRMARILGADPHHAPYEEDINRLSAQVFRYRVECENPGCSHTTLDWIDRITTKYTKGNVRCAKCYHPVTVIPNNSHQPIL